MDQDLFSQQQREKRQRGISFQDEMCESWALVPNCWRMRISDTGGSRPADELILLNEVRILAEHKRLSGIKWELDDLRPNQFTGLCSFEQVSKFNYSLVFVSFLNEKENRDETYCFDFSRVVKTMIFHGCKNVPISWFRSPYASEFSLRLKKLNLELTDTLGNSSFVTRYDLSEVEKWCKSL